MFFNSKNCSIIIPSNSEIMLIRSFIPPDLVKKKIYNITKNPIVSAHPPSDEEYDPYEQNDTDGQNDQDEQNDQDGQNDPDE